MAKSVQVREGIQFRKIGDKVSTTESGKTIFSSAIASLDAQKAQAILKERNWRKHYINHVAPMTAMALRSSDSALSIAKEGLEAAYGQFEFVRNGQSIDMHSAMNTPLPGKYHTTIVKGKNWGRVPEITVPYKGQKLKGSTLKRQVYDWFDRHIIEVSHAEAMLDMIAKPQWQDLSDKYFVLLGAGSEIGPLEFLLDQGANVIAIDLDRQANWERLIKVARESCGTMYIPTSQHTNVNWSDAEIAKVAGANLLTDTPEIADWLASFDVPLTVGSYAYLDSGDHVRVVMAMDAIVDRLLQLEKELNLAYLLTPTDVFAVSDDSVVVSDKRFKKFTFTKPVKSLLRMLSNDRFFAANIRRVVESSDGKTYGIVNSLLAQQGPNYVLAKRLQRWRALIARHQGIRISCNVAPSTATVSVVKNKLFAIGMESSEFFGGEVFQPDTTNALMSLMLMHDIQSKDSAANPDMFLANPEELFMYGANHGGLWRIPNKISSVMEFGVVLGFAKHYWNKVRV